MTMTHIVQGGVVINTILATTTEAQVGYPGALVLDAEATGGGIGWAWDGSMLTPPVEPAAPVDAVDVPEEITTFQAHAVLFKFGLLDAVEAYMELPDTPRIQVLAWQKALGFKRHSPMVLALAKQFELSNFQLDAMFVAGAQIQA